MPWDSLALAASPEILVKRAEVDVAEKELHMIRQDLKPDFLTGAGVGFRAGHHHPVWQFRFGVEVPLWFGSRQKPLIRSAEARLESVRHELREAEAMIRSRAARVEAEWIASESQIARYREAIIPRTSLAFDAARSAYLTGRGDFSMVIEDLNMWLDARAGLAKREAARFSAWAELEEMTSPPALRSNPGEKEQP
jgi:outer membrane protein TolC